VRDRRRPSGGKPGIAPPALVANRSGLEVMRAWSSGELPVAMALPLLTTPIGPTIVHLVLPAGLQEHGFMQPLAELVPR